jgi:hypothetical protein
MLVYVQSNENGDITTWGEAELPGALAVQAPADWAEFSIAKYKVANGELVVREGWVDPEPEA